MPTIECCGSILFYELTGAGAPVLLVHSSACRGGFWRGLTAALGEGFACYTPDLAGYGRSRCESASRKADLRDQAEFIAPLLWHDPQPFHLIGHSFGGAVALAAALAWPHRVRSLTLYEPTPFSMLQCGSREDRELFASIAGLAADMKALLDAGSDDPAMGRFVDFWNGTPVWDGKPAAERAQLSRLAGKMVEDFGLLFEASWRAEDLGRIEFPTLILRGDRSPPVAARVAEVLSSLIPHTRLQTIEGAGHMAPVTAPEPVAAAILNQICAINADAERSKPRKIAAHELQGTGEHSW